MRLQGYDISIKRGETFSIDYLLTNRDGTPYIISSKSNKPYFLLTISSTKYSQYGRYIKNYWLEIPDKNRFYVTRPVKVDSFKDEPVVPDGEQYSDKETYAVYYVTDANGNNIYKRWLNGAWVDYEFRIIKQFSKSDTIEWISQNYVYSIDYVDGIPMLEYLQNLYKDLFDDDDDVPDTVEELYNKISIESDDYADIDFTRALGSIDVTTPIIPDAKLLVNANINGGII